MAISNKLQTVANSVTDIRAALKEINSDYGAGSITSLDDEIRSIGNNSALVVYKDGNDYKTKSVVVTGTLWRDTDKFPITAVAIMLPSNITAIQQDCFQYYTELRYINLNNVINFSGTVFDGCSKLEEIYIYSKNKFTGASAFRNCSALRTITVDGTPSGMSMYGFQNCINIDRINVHSVDDIAKMPYSNGVATPNYYTHKKIHIYSIDTNEELTDIEFSSSVTSIANYAFYECEGLTSIVFPNTLTTISNASFQNCTGLTSLPLPSSLTTIRDSAFQGCTGLTSLTIPANVTTFGNNIVKGCNNLDTLTILSPSVTGKNLSDTGFGYGNLLDIYGDFNKNHGAGVYRFKNIKIRGNMSFGADYGVCDTDLIETFVCKGNYTSERGWICHTYNTQYPSHLAFVEVMGTVTLGGGGAILYGSGTMACADGAILHFGYNGVACTANINKIWGNNVATLNRIGKIYVGDGSSQANDQAVLDAYLASSEWQSVANSSIALGKLDLWWNYINDPNANPDYINA